MKKISSSSSTFLQGIMNTMPKYLSNGKTNADESSSTASSNSNSNSDIKRDKKSAEMKLEGFWKSAEFRPVALKVLYLGWQYHGLARQESTTETVETYIMNSLIRSKLIKDIDSCRFSRSGRTDKGVSAFSQVFGLDIRSRLSREEIDNGLNLEKELPYSVCLNKFLPNDIVVIGWCPTGPDFNARFDCKYREYKYFFKLNGMDVEAMRKASQFLLGTHDFRNYCKKDKSKPNQSFVREIYGACIEPVENGNHGMHVFTIKGSGFLHHQVRCIMAILFSVGRGLDDPKIVLDLFDVAKFQEKPGYQMACENSLVLYDCGYEPELKFIGGSSGSDDRNPSSGSYCPSSKLDLQLETFQLKSLLVHQAISYIRNGSVKEDIVNSDIATLAESDIIDSVLGKRKGNYQASMTGPLSTPSQPKGILGCTIKRVKNS